MRWMITDSGLGGLSVCAGLERTLQEKGLGGGVELLYVNATPDDRIGYNALATQTERIALFDRFLKASTARFTPDRVAIACNTLSVIYHETEFSKETSIPVVGIVDAGVSMIDTHMAANPDHKLAIFATETTIEAGTYSRRIAAEDHMVSAQACPELAHAISNDASGGAARDLLRKYVPEALQRFGEHPKKLFAFLGCTHYGYQAGVFKALLEETGCQVKTLDPNQLLVHQLVSGLDSQNSPDLHPLQVRFVSRYPIPENEISSMESYLKTAAPLTLSALRQQEVIPELFS